MLKLLVWVTKMKIRDNFSNIWKFRALNPEEFPTFIDL